MCDTFVVMPKASNNRKLWFGKNSDRSPNEPNLVINQPAKTYDLTVSPGAELTYIKIPQVPETFALLMIKPVWTWGCEMGVNEHGVCIGNEALFTKGKHSETGLIGMDICRLVLERCSTALDGMRFIGALIEQYGQGGNCGFDETFYYDNSFIVADNAEAFVIETAGMEWVAKRVEDVYAISNAFSIEKEWDYSCESLKNTTKKPDFSKKHADSLRTHFSGASLRRYSVYQTLFDAKDGKPKKNIYTAILGQSFIKHEAAPGISYDTCKEALRAHTPNGGFTDSPCMHYGGAVGSHTTGSLIVCPEDGFVGLTGGSTPCRSIYKPFSILGKLPFDDDAEQAERYWLRRELIQRNLLAGKIDADTYQTECSDLERELDSLLSSFSAVNIEGFNRRVYDIEDDFVSGMLKECVRNPEELVPLRGTSGYRKRWKNKNIVLLERMDELGV